MSEMKKLLARAKKSKTEKFLRDAFEKRMAQIPFAECAFDDPKLKRIVAASDKLWARTSP